MIVVSNLDLIQNTKQKSLFFLMEDRVIIFLQTDNKSPISNNKMNKRSIDERQIPLLELTIETKSD